MDSIHEANDDEEQLIGDEPSVFESEPSPPLHRILQPLTEAEAKEQEKRYGMNVIVAGHRVTWYSILFSALFHPFNILLGILGAGSAAMGDYNAMGVMIVMILISMLIRFIQEWKSAREAQSLKKLISNKVTVVRCLAVRERDSDSISSSSSFLTNASSSSSHMEITTMEILIENLVPGDWIKLSAGDLIPADILLVESNDLFVSQASLTGEAIPVEKFTNPGMIQHSRGNMTVTFPHEETSVAYGTPRTPVKKFCSLIGDFFRHLFGLPVEQLQDIDTSIRAEMDNPNLCYMGTSVVSGTATAIVKYTGSHTYFGSMALELAKHRPQNAFQLGVRRISWIFFLAMAALVPPIFLLQGFLHTGGDRWSEAAAFALSAAVGLTPEMLPMIVSSTLARGAYLMSKKKCIVKNLDSIINMGGMDVLCTDKTGTLTENRVSLMRHVDYYGNTSLIPIQLAFLNSYFQTGLNNLMDNAVIDFYKKKLTNRDTRRRNPLVAAFHKVNEIPFDFIRRRMSVLLHSTIHNGPNLFITKGAVEEMLSICSHAYMGEENVGSVDEASTSAPGHIQTTIREEILPLNTIRIEPLDAFMKQTLIALSNTLNLNGLRVIAVAFKTVPNGSEVLQKSDECEMIFGGFIAFQDPPKQSTLPVIQSLLQNNVHVKVLTGDSAVVCQKICEDIKLHVTGIVTSSDLEGATDKEIRTIVENGTIFAKLTPLQKAQVVRALKLNGHVVGFLGDGINDANALIEADIGISVDNGTDIARESADIILLEKDLRVVADGVTQGRITYGNTLKYIVMAISSNFGNSFSLVVASAWFPFTPMLPIQLLTQNLLYDISQTAIPWDNMDPEFLTVPHRWSMKSVLKFMVCFGPWSSVFDVTFFCYMYFYYGITGAPGDDLDFFRTTWFNIGILTQTFIVHLLRTTKVPFIQSCASVQLCIMTALIIAIAISLPWIPYVSEAFEFVHLPGDIYPFIFLELLAYCVTTHIVKVIYIKVFKEWF